MMRRFRTTLAPVAALALSALASGCVTTEDCAPGRVNILTVAACEGSGAAQQREDEKRAQAEATEAEAEALRQELQTARAEIAVRRTERQSLEERLSAIDGAMLRLRGTLSRARGIETVNQQRLAELERQLSALETARRQAGPNLDAARVESIERDMDAVYDEMNALLGVAAS